MSVGVGQAGASLRRPSWLRHFSIDRNPPALSSRAPKFPPSLALSPLSPRARSLTRRRTREGAKCWRLADHFRCASKLACKIPHTFAAGRAVREPALLRPLQQSRALGAGRASRREEWREKRGRPASRLELILSLLARACAPKVASRKVRFEEPQPDRRMEQVARPTRSAGRSLARLFVCSFVLLLCRRANSLADRRPSCGQANGNESAGC